jgi:para-nitrobenzyl esterase
MRVEIDTGVLVGDVSGDVARFRAIPFADRPVGRLRFRRPEPAPRWSGERRAIDPAPAPQQDTTVGVGLRGAAVSAEDCLYLNVFAPAARATQPRPVFVWIYGGGYLHGDGADPLFDGSNLARSQDLVVVTFNYRLGLWGFAPLVERNVGLADQIAALEWVARNIGKFGGDPGNVTLAGESSGAMSVCNLLTAPSARGLFHRAIAQSGAAGHVATRAQADETAQVARAELGIDPDEATAARILAAQRATIAHLRPRHHGSPLRPHVDGDLLPVHPLAAAQTGSCVPLIIGINRDEYRLYIRASLKLPDDALRAHLERRLTESGADDVADTARRLVAHYRSLGADSRNPNAAMFAAIETELRFRDPMLRYALARGRNTWMYRFDWPSPALRGWLGATHAIDIPFVFGNFELASIAKFVGAGPDATALSRNMMALWADFARNGRPPRSWEAFTADRRIHLVLNRTITSERIDDDATVRLWDTILRR